jgi:hypothetical protein
MSITTQNSVQTLLDKLKSHQQKIIFEGWEKNRDLSSKEDFPETRKCNKVVYQHKTIQLSFSNFKGRSRMISAENLKSIG